MAVILILDDKSTNRNIYSRLAQTIDCPFLLLLSCSGCIARCAIVALGPPSEDCGRDLRILSQSLQGLSIR
jgi:hypothetical protein